MIKHGSLVLLKASTPTRGPLKRRWPAQVLEIRNHKIYGEYMLVVYILQKEEFLPKTDSCTCNVRENELFRTNEIHITSLTCVSEVMRDNKFVFGSKTFEISERYLQWDGTSYTLFNKKTSKSLSSTGTTSNMSSLTTTPPYQKSGDSNGLGTAMGTFSFRTLLQRLKLV